MKPRKLVHGVGVNDADYVVEKREEIGYVNGKRKRKTVWTCLYYKTWKNMLTRCYSKRFQEHNKTYIGCTVANEWLTFTNFKSWMETQDFDGLELDKDILIKGNKVYSARTCVFVTRTVNTFTLDRCNDRGKWLLGVCWYKPTEKFQVRCRNPFTKKQENLGYFTCEQEAHQVWMKRKLELAHELAAIQTDPRVAEALINRYTRTS